MTNVIVEIKCTLVQALRLCTGRTAQMGSRGIAILFLDHGTRRGEGSASRPGRSLPPGKTRYPSYRRLGGLQGRSGQVRKISPQPGFDPRTVQHVVSRYTDWATGPTNVIITFGNFAYTYSKHNAGLMDKLCLQNTLNSWHIKRRGTASCQQAVNSQKITFS